nr:glycosyltransferase [Sphingobium sp. OAS761]
MRIVDVCAFYAPQGGGVKTYVERKLRAAVPGRQHVTVLAPGEGDAVVTRFPGGEIRTMKAPLFPLDARYRYFNDETALHRMLDRLAPDLVEASSPWGSAAMVGRWSAPVPRALIMHADPLAAYAYRWFGGIASRQAIDRGFDWFWRHLRRLDARFDMVVSANARLTDRLRAGGLRHCHTIAMGVEPGLFSPLRRDEALRTRLLRRCGLSPDAMLLVALGRHSSEKRWPMVFDAVRAAGYDRPVGLVLFGDGREQGKVVRSAAGNPHIHLAAPVTDRPALAAILASADALVHGCEAETFCMVAAEAKASGLPVIVPDEGGAGDQFRPGLDERYTATSGAALADAIRRLIDRQGPALRDATVRAAADVPGMDAHFDRLFALYAAQAGEVAHAA